MKTSDFVDGQLFSPRETRGSSDFERTQRQSDSFPTPHDSDISNPRFESIWYIKEKIAIAAAPRQ
jgi:hypothetical protein